MTARYRLKVRNEVLARLNPHNWPVGVVCEGLHYVGNDGTRVMTILDEVAAAKWEGKLVGWTVTETYTTDGTSRGPSTIVEMWEEQG